MSDIAIRVEGLSKAYQIRHTQARSSYRTLREDLVALAQKPLRRGGGQTRETFWALDDVSFEVRHGEALGIIGRNGAGKSTLLKILSRITKPTRGQATVYGRVGSLLEVGTGFHPELTGRENIFLNGAILGMTRRDIQRHFDEIVDFAEIEQFLDTPVKRYSSGMYMRLAFAVAAHLEPEVLVVDEVLAVGDAAFQKKCLGKMGEVASGGRTVLFVSHNMAAVQQLCSRGIWLEKGLIAELGSADSVVSSYLNKNIAGTSGTVFANVESAPGNDRIRVRGIRVVPSEADTDLPITMTTPVKVEIDYWNLTPDTLLNVSLHVLNAEGTVAFSSVPIDVPEWLEHPHPVGLFRSTCFIPGHLLNSGLYQLNVYFVEGQARVILEYRDALAFDVADSAETRGRSSWFGKWPGVLHPRTHWQVEQLDLAQNPEGSDVR